MIEKKKETRQEREDSELHCADSLICDVMQSDDEEEMSPRKKQFIGEMSVVQHRVFPKQLYLSPFIGSNKMNGKLKNDSVNEAILD